MHARALARFALGALASCSARQAAPSDGPPSVLVAPAESTEVEDRLTSELSECAVSDDRPSYRVLYSWTTKEQAEELARNRVLFTRSRSPTRGPALIDTLLASDDSPAGRFIRRELGLRRFAWPHAWATVAGWEGETYGDQLIRIELASEAMIGRFRPGKQPAWAFFDLDGRPIPSPVALRQPERLAAIHHAGSFREVVLTNEAMIAKWQLATPEVMRELGRGTELLRQLERRISAGQGDAELSALWTACLAFPNDRYQLTRSTLARVRAALEAAQAAQGRRIEQYPLGDRSLPDPGFAKPPPPLPAKGGSLRACGTYPCP